MMRLGVTDCGREDKLDQYVEWIHSVDKSVEVVKFSHKAKGSARVSDLDGMLLTGGGDVHPKFYGMEQQASRTSDVNEQRDLFEFEIIEQALSSDLPLLGVCRGMQVVNVSLGGSLFTDLVSEGYGSHESPKGKERRHRISIAPHSLLRVLAERTEQDVNSYHHQAVQKLGQGLVPSAVSEDGVVEAAEWAIKDGMPFLMLVQWHPERSLKEVVSQNLATLFLREIHTRTTATPER